MAPGRALFQLNDRAAPTTNSDPDGLNVNVVYVLGIVLAGSVFAGLLLWLAWRRWREHVTLTTQTAPEMSEKRKTWTSRALSAGLRPAPAAIVVPRPLSTVPIIISTVPTEETDGVIPPVAAYLPPLRLPGPPPSPIRPGSYASTTPSRQSRLRYSVLPEDSRRATMTENEILDYHLHHGNMPVAFAPIAIGSMEGHRSSSSLHGSVTADILSMVEAEGKHDSSSTISSLLWPKLNPGPKAFSPTTTTSAHGSHGRFSSFSASIRFPGSSPPASPARSFFTFGHSHLPRISQLPAPTPENQRIVRITAFNPLLPDELVISMDETLTVVSSYDDNWCIVARMNLGMLEVGAVPEYVFGLKEGENETFATMRPMRSSSLGVTVDLRVVEAGNAAGGQHWTEVVHRASLVSWSNF